MLFTIFSRMISVVICLQPLQCGDRLYMLECDVCRGQILTYKDGPRTENF